MRRYCILLFIAVILISCGSNESTEQKQTLNTIDSFNKNNTDSVSVVQDNAIKDESKPVLLSEDDFVKKVFNYRENEKWKYAGDKPCMVDFYADWCGPCRMISPYMVEFAKTYHGKMHMYKVNIDYARELTSYFRIRSIPAVMFCPMNGNYKMLVGANPKDVYVSLIETFLNVKK